MGENLRFFLNILRFNGNLHFFKNIYLFFKFSPIHSIFFQFFVLNGPIFKKKINISKLNFFKILGSQNTPQTAGGKLPGRPQIWFRNPIFPPVRLTQFRLLKFHVSFSHIVSNALLYHLVRTLLIRDFQKIQPSSFYLKVGECQMSCLVQLD